MPHSLQLEVPEAESIDVSSISPWREVVGSPFVEVARDGPSELRLVPARGDPIWVLARNYIDDLDQILSGGDSVLVIHDFRLARSHVMR